MTIILAEEPTIWKPPLQPVVCHRHPDTGARVSEVTDAYIKGFFGEYRWLSNFHEAPVNFNGRTWPTAEHAYMSCKTDIHSELEHLASLKTGAQAREYGQQVTLSDGYEGWLQKRFERMKGVKYAQYRQNPELLDRLIDTGFKYLEETNDWGDNYWGKADPWGNNNLGKINMFIREAARSVMNIKRQAGLE